MQATYVYIGRAFTWVYPIVFFLCLFVIPFTYTLKTGKTNKGILLAWGLSVRCDGGECDIPASHSETPRTDVWPGSGCRCGIGNGRCSRSRLAWMDPRHDHMRSGGALEIAGATYPKCPDAK